MANPKNEAMVAELRESLADASTFFVVDYQGLSAGELGTLRAAVRNAGGRLLVAKNTLIRVVLQEQGVEGFDETLTGPTALVLVGDDPVAPVKALSDFAEEHDADLPVAKGGLLQGGQVGPEAFAKIAKLPSRDEILSELVGVLQAPMQRLVGVLSGPPRDLVSVMTNYKAKLEEGN
ncbi:MAG: 50S ribosomal protein L10 [Trueperaceae bacterium]|jgi:large subunit ribosomal protein L10|nr:50S ribosomal protein L10 [Trueperaceae bacterium]